MKCSKCSGAGYIYNNLVGYAEGCSVCHGKGEVQTNEEWLRSASANDMARCIATKLCELAKHEYGIYDVVDYATIFEWLKEIHDEM